ncbi:hypothetical protein B0H11DRAFT_1745140 [Mycena galericulata]|nr:hypothetical protein B0H11DRAFT_1745140 [Mycena galericulata]
MKGLSSFSGVVPDGGSFDAVPSRSNAPTPVTPSLQYTGYVPQPLPGNTFYVPKTSPQDGAGNGSEGGGVIQVVNTEDAATQVNDCVRRRCFNCCTTDTTTWRRSNFSPGKVLCNKCELYERTHSQPRPDSYRPLTSVK